MTIKMNKDGGKSDMPEIIQKRIWNIITTVLCVLAVLCVFLPFLKLDLASITGGLGSFFTDIDIWVTGKKFSTIELIKALIEYRKALEINFVLFMAAVILPNLLPLAITGIAWTKAKARYIFGIVFSLLFVAITIVLHMLVIPKAIERIVNNMIDDTIGGNILSLFNRSSLTAVFGEQAAKAYKQSLGLGFLVPIILMVLVIIVSVLGFILTKDEVKVSNQNVGYMQGNMGNVRNVGNIGNISGQLVKGPSITGISGVFQGVVFPMQKNETIVVGRDPTCSHIVIESEQISRKHCGISFNEITGQYTVTDFSSNGTFVNHSRRIMRNEPQFVQRGDTLSLGDSKNSLRLD